MAEAAPSSDGGTTVIEEFDPMKAEHSADAFAWFARARRDRPVFHMRRYDMWAVTRHDDCLAVLRDATTFSNVGAMDVRIAPPRAIRETVPRDYAFPISTDSLTVVDPPRHTRGRKAIQPMMSPKSINARTGEITGIADRLIDGFAADGRVELMRQFAFRLPIEAFSPLLGISVEQTARLLQWADDWFRIVGTGDLAHDEAVARWKGLLEWDAWTRQLIDDRRRCPGDDVISRLVAARAPDGCPAMTDDELVGNVCNLIAGGVDTTAYLIGQLVYDLLANGLWHDVRDDRRLIAGAVEESMRLLGPVRSVRRTATRDVEIGGVSIPRGAELWVILHSANRDERAFDEPDAFHVRRPSRSRSSGFGQLGFGNGVHFCVGAPLARVEAHVAIDRLVDRLPNLHLAEPRSEPPRAVSFVLPGLQSLDLEWGR